MINYGSRFFITLRKILRRLGMARRLSLLLRRDEGIVWKYLIEAVSKKGVTFFDVGANTGQTIIEVVDQVSDKADLSIVAVEANTFAFNEAKNRLRSYAGAFHDLVLLNKAVAKQAGTLQFPVDGGAGSLSENSSLLGTNKVNSLAEKQFFTQVEAISLTGLLHTAATDKIAIKVDVEGYEIEIFDEDQLRILLSDSRVFFILIEVHFSRIEEAGCDPASFVKRLSQSGFDLKWLDFSHCVLQRL